MHLSGLFIYPVKSLRGFAVPAAGVDALGLVGDRRFLVIGEEGQMLTQRAVPRMALVATALTPTDLVLSADGAGEVTIPRASDAAAPLRQVAVWKSEGMLAEDCGDAAANWLSHVLQLKCRLVRIGEKFLRPVLKVPASLGTGAKPTVSFADAFPFLVISEASLGDLNDRLIERGEEPLPMNRFRTNLVVSGCAPFAEDTWTRFQIGDIVFHAGGPCSRCIMTTTDQLTGERGKEPLRTLATYRRDVNDPSDVNFGQNLIHETPRGTLRIGDPVTVL